MYKRQALRKLHDAGLLRPGMLKIRFRAAVAEDLLHRLAAEHQVQDYVEVLPPAPYRDALAEMLRADGLLIMQASNCNAQIPAKLYEYLRARRPIVCLSDAAGDTVQALRAAGVALQADLARPEEIAELLQRFVAGGDRAAFLPTDTAIAQASRLHRSSELAQLLDGIVQQRAAAAS